MKYLFRFFVQTNSEYDPSYLLKMYEFNDDEVPFFLCKDDEITIDDNFYKVTKCSYSFETLCDGTYMIDYDIEEVEY